MKYDIFCNLHFFLNYDGSITHLVFRNCNITLNELFQKSDNFRVLREIKRIRKIIKIYISYICLTVFIIL